MKKLFFFLIISLAYSSVFSQKAVDDFVNAPNLSRANISLFVKEVETGKVVMEHRAEKVTVPASTTKLVTTATALELFGPNFAFETKLQYDGVIRGNLLEGNIYILGSGDPTLGSKYMGDSLFLEKWTDAVKQLGISKINGAIIADASIFNSEGIAPKWSWEDMGNYYAAGAYGISIYDNTYKLYFKSGNEGTTPEIIRTEPEMLDLQFNLHLKASQNDKDSAYIYGAPFSNERLVYGSIPANKNEFVIKGDIPNPPLYLAQLFTKKLQEKGIQITQSPTVEFSNNTADRKEFFIEISPPLIDIITNINHKSNNHYAEHLFRYLSLYEYPQASTATSVKTIKTYWIGQGIDVSGLVMHDGCGLSPSNAISAKFFVDLLIHEKTHSTNADNLLASLPKAGESGTLKNFLKNTQLEGKVQAKSGSIFGVQCFAGYLTDKNGKQYAFAILVSNYSGIRKNIVVEIQKLLLSIGK